MTAHDAGGLEILSTLPSVENVSEKESNQEKESVSFDATKEKDIDSSLEARADDSDDTVYLNGEPVITTGLDVSRFLIDIRDDGDDALTFRSLFLGTVMAGLGAALCQVYFMSLVEGTRFQSLGPALHFLNPGEFKLKEVS
ncbi:hypothetical protein H0H81_012483 [Sphagnurus paluster]|uniref:Uncharacterized protein n=1 Tax=Sphagnurus paluster TaxID=117069 RepID=A0A9P7KH90_9AGAR|nr:hypothetical protein H0H81_012483 [Sphagnurus paluster]